MPATHVNEALRKIKMKEKLDFDDMTALLDMDENSPEANVVMMMAHAKSKAICQGKGQIWYAIGLDSAPCPNTCEFCSFSKKWRTSSETWKLEQEQVIRLVKEHDQPGVTNIVLRSTVLYPLSEILEIGIAIGPLRYAKLTVNIGDLAGGDAEKLIQSGFHTAYHTLRLGEGTDTNILPQDRLLTIKKIHQSELKLAALVEPVGREHEAKELAERIITYRDADVALCGAMARVPVPGTPKAHIPPVSQLKLALITAVIRLSLDANTHSICSHPPSIEVSQAGANTVVVESGAIPRDVAISHGSWNSFTIADAQALLTRAGYII